MRLSGIDPGIIRELSGIYKPFVKAFKELVSNAYDADANIIRVTLSDDFSSLDVLDDGIGMTPYDFHESFARIGRSTAWLQSGMNPSGRPRIGYKGIGFLAVGRYCNSLHVESHCQRPYKGQKTVLRRNRKTIPLNEVVGDVVPLSLLRNRLKITTIRIQSESEQTCLKLRRDYICSPNGVRLLSARSRKASALAFDYSVNCCGLLIKAVLDFDYLIGLERKADLRLLDDFCTLALAETDPQSEAYTRVRLHKLKDFVVRDLSAPRVKGKARNVISKSGREQFIWRLARSSPICDDVREGIACAPIRQLSEAQNRAKLPVLVVKWPNEEPITLKRPIYLAREQRSPLNEGIIPIKIEQNGLRATGYLLARNEIIYPAELRGLSIRVRHVAIGEPSFLGWEHVLSGPRKAALSQITGEILVSRGLDAADAVNPGRESFYEENAHYRLLKQSLFGSEETIGGVVGEATQQILQRIHVRSQLSDALGEARNRRRALVELSSAVNFYSRDTGNAGAALKSFFNRSVQANGLTSARDICLRPEHTLAGFKLEARKADKRGESGIDFGNRRVWIDFDHDTWSNTVYLLGDYYEVVIKQGRPGNPICEFDTLNRRIYVNWGHPVKIHMDEAAFLKSAILLRLAHYAVPENGDAMMELALNMLAFRME